MLQSALPLSAVAAYLSKTGNYDGPISDVPSIPLERAISSALTDERSKEPNRYLEGMGFLNWPEKRKITAATQLLLRSLGLYSGNIDGLYGPNTMYGIEQWQDLMRDDHTVDAPHSWPAYHNLESFYGAPGENLVTVPAPYPMRLAWDKTSTVTRITLNKKCAASAQDVLAEVLKVYGIDAIRELHLDLYGGGYNKRKMRGGSSWSVHAYGAAMDFDPERNQLRWGKDRAEFAKVVYNKWWSCWERAGWLSLGRTRNYDFMHVQAAGL
jgi:hypothetical protein